MKSGITDGKVTLERVGDTKTTVTSAVTNSAKTALINGSVVAEFQDTSITPVGTLTGELIFAKLQDSAGGKSVKAGTYTGTMTFEGAVTVR
ncbi:MAG: hypothetical protein RR472_05635 [Anaerovoracaceae bacterium]